jgi:transcriptional regulator with XRE-family HTH domain
MVATLRLRSDELAKYRKLAQITTDDELARRMGVDPATVSRVLRGLQAPGGKFIAALVATFAFADVTLDDLFEVLPADEKVPA